MPMIRAMRLLNAVEAGTLSGAQLQNLLATDSGRLAEWNVLLGMRGQMRRMAASSTAMTAVAASSTAMTAVVASSTAMTAVAASSTAMTAVNASDQALRIWTLAGTNQIWSNFANFTAVVASSTAMTAVAASSTAMTAVAASSTAMTAVVASSTAMTAVAASSTALLACWNSETALTALRTQSAALMALRSSPFKRTIGNSSPSNLTSPMVSGKVILLESRSYQNSDSIMLGTKYQNGRAVANHMYITTSADTMQMVAFQDIRHIVNGNNTLWWGYVLHIG